MRYPKASYVFQGHCVRGLLFAGCTLLYLKHRVVVLNPHTLYYVGGEWQTPTLRRGTARGALVLRWREEEWIFS